MTVAAVSALTGQPVDGSTAVTGEISVQGRILPVGGVPEKIKAAQRAFLRGAVIPRANMRPSFAQSDMEVTPVDTLEEALGLALIPEATEQKAASAALAAG